MEETRGQGTMPGAVVRINRDGAACAATRPLAEEVPVSLTYNGIAHVVMMATPRDIEDFAVGFSLAEGIVDSASEIAGIEVRPIPPGLLVRVDIPGPRAEQLIDRRRGLVGQTGCGICGVTELEHAIRAVRVVGRPPALTPDALFRALDGLADHQPLNRETGAVHAAAYADSAGRILLAREDVGRHNALDKLIGALARQGAATAEGFALVTSRCSFELVQKCASAGLPALVAISAPTDLAVDLARRAGLTLVALARRDSVLVFNDPDGLFPPSAGAPALRPQG
ncbi:formate dehydrogenase accessory sulfurtransferase FdhD [Pedomonas sp. V897]|uniref:formate dehydrogenase accessory sulfurtransferase FdhD n=1 Tax=Pedomonas sp. V897 TaxID=3446482 RepID=UPI003EDEF9BD